VGLKIAKDTIEAIERGKDVTWQSRLAGFDLEHVHALIRAGRQLDAAAYYQQQLGLTSGDARATVAVVEDILFGRNELD